MGQQFFQVLCFISTCGICCANGTRLAIKSQHIRSPSHTDSLCEQEGTSAKSRFQERVTSLFFPDKLFGDWQRMSVRFGWLFCALCLSMTVGGLTQKGLKETLLQKLQLSEVPKLQKRDVMNLVIPEHIRNKYISMLRHHRVKRRALPSLAGILRGIPGNAGNTAEIITVSLAKPQIPTAAELAGAGRGWDLDPCLHPNFLHPVLIIGWNQLFGDFDRTVSEMELCLKTPFFN